MSRRQGFVVPRAQPLGQAPGIADASPVGAELQEEGTPGAEAPGNPASVRAGGSSMPGKSWGATREARLRAHWASQTAAALLRVAERVDVPSQTRP